MSQVIDRRDFAIVVPSYLDDYGLDPYEYRLYSHIVRRAGKNGCFESIPNMAKHCLMNEKTVRNSLRVLLGAGMIAVVESKKGRSVVYEVAPHEEWVTKEELPSIRNKRTPTKSGTTTPTKSGTTTPTKSGTTTPTKSGTTPLPNLVDEVFPSKEVPFKEIPLSKGELPPNPQNGNSEKENKNPQSVEVEVLKTESALEQTRFPGNQNSESLLPTENPSLGQNSPPLANNEAQLTEGFQSLTGKNPQTGKDYFPWEGLTMQQGRQKVTSDPDFVSYVAKSLASKYSMYKELNLVELRRETSKFIHKAGTDFNREIEVQNYWDDYLSGISTTATIRDVERASKPRIYFGVRL